ncbi:hypothetical protein BpHYR1_001253 [Brachionus plicatilis]|uniref:Uncharacterized protein n=1 Tax=Brachionus plicatilis TaxID=10195 RepID=A0A3M7RCE6_BRAPC|nr:hypothetical protein BpHYR1_001253 [Brachionus plicatilis]
MSQNREIKNVLVENSSLEKNKSSSSKSSDDNSDFEHQNFVGNDSITSNKDFTNSLRGLITKRFMDDPGQTSGHYQKTHPNSMLEIKNELQKYVPKNSTFKEAWEKAANSFKMDKSSKKKN